MKLRVDMKALALPNVLLKFGTGEQVIEATTLLNGFTDTTSESWVTSGDGIIRRRTFADIINKREVQMTERFQPSSSGVRWETELWTDYEEPFTAPVISEIRCDSVEWPNYWATWADHRPDGPDTVGDPWAVANADLDAVKDLRFSWQDPLIPRKAESRRFWYGAPYFEEDNPRLGFSPFMNDLICMPLVCAFHASSDVGLTFALSPEEPLLDVFLDTDKEGAYRFTRMFYRFEKGRPLRFSADLFTHENDWRGSLRRMTERYPQYFHSPLSITQDIAGTGAYSTHEVEFDEMKMQKMAFKVNWKASFDFPYMGMFLPDVSNDEEWMSYGKYPQTIARMREYSAKMHSRGFHVLSYFNVTEFGADVQFPLPDVESQEGSETDQLWKDCSLYLSRELKEALLLNRQGQPYWSWANAVVMDPGEPVYQQFLLDQARRHLELIPESSGICIDRLDWTRFYNDSGDDGISWFDGKPCRSLQVSWQQVSEQLGELFHAHNKVVYCNNHTKRLEQLLHVDGIFDEFTYAAAALNLSAMLGLFKPVLGWIAHAGQVMPDYDVFFQRFLYMGVFPMAPFPGNDHSLLPSPEVDEAFLAYGPLLDRLRGKRWTLSPRPVSVVDNVAIANVFEVPGGYVVPVVFAKAETVRLVLRLPEFAMKDRYAVYEILHPGSDDTMPVHSERREGSLELEVAVRNGCAMVIVHIRSDS
ncbi:hypothetical protein [Paenibacillus sp. Soil787]|uniref:hypothetical protein n=1 Tax=Paenibacillus sp. Soil787 TaxID=1736411 RepID=UPI0006FF0E80|nr:hypothetical protein [Paenibacillus sp. Soil787]KRF42979.1 hypothetical protein ASG93_20730 [Paenibacillus sp. Soil787]